MSESPISRRLSATSMPRHRARRSSSTAYTSGGYRAPRAPSGNTPRSTSPPPTPGASCTPPRATRAQGTPASSCTESYASSPPPAGSCARSPPTTAQNSAPASSKTKSQPCRHASASSAPAPNSNGCVKQVQVTILEECWRPAFARSLVLKMTALSQDLNDPRHHLRSPQKHPRTMITCRNNPGLRRVGVPGGSVRESRIREVGARYGGAGCAARLSVPFAQRKPLR